MFILMSFFLYIFNLIIIFFCNSFFLSWLYMEIIGILLICFMFYTSLNNYNKMNGLMLFFFLQIISGMGIFIGMYFCNFYILMLFILLKLGSFPVHTWVIRIYSMFNIDELFILSGMSKIQLFFFILLINNNFYMFFFASFFSIFISSIYSLKFSNLMCLMGSFGIMSTGWLIVFFISKNYVILNLYLFLIIFLLYYFFKNNLYSLMYMLFFLIFMSGFPPSIFFFIKFYIFCKIFYFGFFLIFFLIFFNCIWYFVFYRLMNIFFFNFFFFFCNKNIIYINLFIFFFMGSFLMSF
uniref:NADH dehydrogenase subunit 2 n=1 Tax=Lissoclinum sp. TIC-2013-079 TaxID=2010181 RepID=A0A2D1BXR2_9ASCI|nr:NADH dehydrogenase subunit 2 [Lissoclinum sp. TIC-2013-079]